MKYLYAIDGIVEVDGYHGTTILRMYGSEDDSEYLKSFCVTLTKKNLKDLIIFLNHELEIINSQQEFDIE